MKQSEEFSVEKSQLEPTLEESKAHTKDELDQAFFSVSEGLQGVPLLRGSQPRSSWENRLRQVGAQSVWLPVLGKLAVGALILASTAYLGRRAKDEERYGKVLIAEVQGDASLAPTSLVNEPPALKELPLHSMVGKPVLLGSQAKTPSPCQKGLKSDSGPKGVTKDGRVILNEASAEEMTQLPSVGPARAKAIVKLRERLGRFKKISDLLRVRGIGWKTLKKMKEKAVVDRPAQEEGEPSAANLAPSDASASGVAKSKGGKKGHEPRG